MTAYASLQTVLDGTTGRYLASNSANWSPTGVPNVAGGDTVSIAAAHSILATGNFTAGDPSGAVSHTGLQVANGGRLTVWGELTTYGLVKFTSVTGVIEVIDQGTGTVAKWNFVNALNQQASIQSNGAATGAKFKLYGTSRARVCYMVGSIGTSALPIPVIQPSAFYLALETDDAYMMGIGTVDTLRGWTSERKDGGGYATGYPLILNAMPSFKVLRTDATAHVFNSTGAFCLNPTTGAGAISISATVAQPDPLKGFIKGFGGAVPGATSGTPPTVYLNGPDWKVTDWYMDNVTHTIITSVDTNWRTYNCVFSSEFFSNYFINHSGNTGHRYERVAAVVRQEGVTTPNIHGFRDTINNTSMGIGPVTCGLAIIDGLDFPTGNGDLFVNGYAVTIERGIALRSSGNFADNVGTNGQIRVQHLSFLTVGYGPGGAGTGAGHMPVVISESSHNDAKLPEFKYCLGYNTWTFYSIGGDTSSGGVTGQNARQASGVWTGNAYFFSPSFIPYNYMAPDGGPGPVAAAGPESIGGGSNGTANVVTNVNLGVGTGVLDGNGRMIAQFATGLGIVRTDTLYVAGGARAGAAAGIYSYDTVTGIALLEGQVRIPGGASRPTPGTMGVPGLASGDLVSVYQGIRKDGLGYGTGDFGGTDVRAPDPQFKNLNASWYTFDSANGGPGTVTNLRANLIKNMGIDQSGTPTAAVPGYSWDSLFDYFVDAATPTNQWYALNKAPDGKSYGAVDIAASVSLTAPVATPGSPAATSVPLTWTASTGGTAPITYTVQYRPGMSGTWLTSASGVAGTSATVTGLTQSTLYSFQIIATDAVAATATSAAVSATTTTLSTLVAPTVTLGTPTVSTLPITWTAATGGTAPYLYQVEYAPTPSVGNPTGWAAFGTWVSGTAATITGLLSGRTYSIRVVVRDVTGYEVTSAVITGTTTTPAPFVGQAARLTPQQNASVAALAGGTLYDFGNATAYGEAGFVLVTIANAAGGFSATFRGELAGTPVTVSSPQQSYYNQAAPTVLITGATAITANGTYKVPGTNLNTSMHKTAGTATVTFTLGVEP